MSAALTAYQNGMEHLLKRIDKNLPAYATALVLQARLNENIAKARAFGDPESRESQRWEIIDSLNDLARQVIGMTFNELCMFGSAPLPPMLLSSESFSDFLTLTRTYIVTLWDTIREARKLFSISNNEDIWPLQCENTVNAFEHCDKFVLPSSPSLAMLEVKLAYIDEKVRSTIELIDDFSPNGRKSTKQATKQRGEIRKNLKLLIRDIEAIVDLISSLSGSAYSSQESILVISGNPSEAQGNFQSLTPIQNSLPPVDLSAGGIDEPREHTE